ncbi:MAG: CsbD family protein [Solirubrobacteraceae bacterium]
MPDGQIDRALGKLKQAAGNLTGDNSLKASGKVDQAAGMAKEAVGKLAGAVKGAINSDTVQGAINSRKKPKE